MEADKAALGVINDEKAARAEQLRLEQAAAAKDREYQEMKEKVDGAKRQTDELTVNLTAAKAAFETWKAADAAHVEGHADWAGAVAAVAAIEQSIADIGTETAALRTAFDAVVA